ncbi:hypothetical protein GALL_97860 [mine drainage metagenome]|uniref:Lipoprotein n=1 Tax=mine drainage metagenome TaxID=410659 RepID=A0A1J5SJ20_9ZZZZ
MPKRLLLLVLPLLLAGCAGDVGWINPRDPQANAEDTYAGCRRAAERDYGQSGYQAAADSRFGDPMAMADREASGDRVREAVAACMRAEGFIPKK